MSLRIIDRNIRTITGNISKLNDLIQATGLLIMAHAREHGDCTRALVLVKAMPASMRRTMLVDWFNRNSPIRVSLTNDKVGMLKESAKGYVAFDIEAATAVPFYVSQTRTDDGETKPFEFDSIGKARDSLVKRFNKLIDDGNVPEDDVASVRAALDLLNGLTFTKVAPDTNVANLPVAPMTAAA